MCGIDSLAGAVTVTNVTGQGGKGKLKINASRYVDMFIPQ